MVSRGLAVTVALTAACGPARVAPVASGPDPGATQPPPTAPAPGTAAPAPGTAGPAGAAGPAGGGAGAASHPADLCATAACSRILQFDVGGGSEEQPDCANFDASGRFVLVGKANQEAGRVGFDVTVGAGAGAEATIRSLPLQAAPDCARDPDGGFHAVRTRVTSDVQVRCGNSLSGNCFTSPSTWTLASVAQDGAVRWEVAIPLAETTAQDIAENEPAFVSRIVVDASGSTWVAAGFPVYAPRFRYDAALSRIDRDGHVQWTQVFTAANVTIARTDDLGRAYVVVGSWSDASTAVLTVASDGSVQASFAVPGEWVWSRGLDFDPAGPTYAVTTSATTLYVSRIAPSGAQEWTVAVGEDLALRAIARDPSGHPWLVGTHASTAGRDRMFVARLDPAGAVEWRVELASGAFDVPLGVAFASDGAGWVWGITTGTFAEAPDSRWDAPGGQDAFVARFGPAGELR